MIDDQTRIHIDYADQQVENGKPQTERDVCPECGAETYSGFGLMGGGYGSYSVCDTCGWFYKVQCDE